VKTGNFLSFQMLMKLGTLLYLDSELIFAVLSLESAYRTWVSEKREGISSSDSEELLREVQTALGTAKWQVT